MRRRQVFNGFVYLQSNQRSLDFKRERWRAKKEKCMTENNSKRLPKFESLDALVDFFDRNDLGDYLEQMPEAEFEMDLKKRSYLVAADEEVGRRLAEISQREHLPSDTLVNSWLREKISDYSEKR